METIEKLAWEYVDAPCDQDCGNCDRWTSSCRFCLEVRSFIGGAKVQYQLLTKWNDPKQPPTHSNDVLIKYHCGTGGCDFFIVAYYSNGKWKTPFAPDYLDEKYDKILGWREIHE